jgi:multidrug efflux pump subunit AcrB
MSPSNLSGLNGSSGLSGLVERYGRAIVTVTVVLAAAGLLTAFTLPSDIYPPLIFPRVVVSATAGRCRRDR